ncbi:hypothetical protein HDV05_006452 [Chytridiales sp. JEL 0842]|nr:hypothetical protein HDV05_006452 [Chytridiales sp. JEL 0842]
MPADRSPDHNIQVIVMAPKKDKGKGKRVRSPTPPYPVLQQEVEEEEEEEALLAAIEDSRAEERRKRLREEQAAGGAGPSGISRNFPEAGAVPQTSLLPIKPTKILCKCGAKPQHEQGKIARCALRQPSRRLAGLPPLPPECPLCLKNGWSWNHVAQSLSCPFNPRKDAYFRGLNFPSRTGVTEQYGEPYFNVAEQTADTPPLRYGDLVREHAGVDWRVTDFPSEPSSGSTLFLSGYTGASGTLQSSGKEQEAVEIEQENLVAWQKERGKLYASAALAKEAYDAEVELELLQLKGTTEKFTVVTSLSPYMVNPAFHRFISDVVIRDFTRLSTNTSLFVNWLLLRVCSGQLDEHMADEGQLRRVVRRTDLLGRLFCSIPNMTKGKPLFRKCLYAFSQEDAIDVRPDNEEDLLLRQCVEDFKDVPWYENVERKGYSNPINFLQDQMAVNFHENIVRNLYPRLLSYFKMGLSSLPAFMLKEVGGLPEDVGNLELDVVWRAEGEDLVDEEIEEQVVDGFVNRRIEPEEAEEMGVVEEDEEDDDMDVPMVDDEAADQVQNPYGCRINRLASLLTNVFYFGNDFLIETFATGHPRTVRRILGRMVERECNRLFTPTRTMVDRIQLMTRSVLQNYDARLLPDFKKATLGRSFWAALPLMYHLLLTVDTRAQLQGTLRSQTPTLNLLKQRVFAHAAFQGTWLSPRQKTQVATFLRKAFEFNEANPNTFLQSHENHPSRIKLKDGLTSAEQEKREHALQACTDIANGLLQQKEEDGMYSWDATTDPRGFRRFSLSPLATSAKCVFVTFDTRGMFDIYNYWHRRAHGAAAGLADQRLVWSEVARLRDGVVVEDDQGKQLRYRLSPAQPTDDDKMQRWFSGTFRTDGLSAHWIIDRPKSRTTKIDDCATKQLPNVPSSLVKYREATQRPNSVFADPGRGDLAVGVSDGHVEQNGHQRAIGSLPAVEPGKGKKAGRKVSGKNDEKKKGQKQKAQKQRGQKKKGKKKRKKKRSKERRRERRRIRKRERKQLSRAKWQPLDHEGGWPSDDNGLPSHIPRYIPIVISNREWHERAGHVSATKKRGRLLDQNERVTDILESTPAAKTSNVFLFEEYMEHITLFDHFKSHRKIRLTTYVKEKKAEDFLVKKLVRGQPNTTVFWGSGTKFFASPTVSTNLRGTPAPAKRFMRAVAGHYLVEKLVLVDEYRSSTIDPYSLERVSKMSGERKVDGSEGSKLYKVLRAPRDGTIWQRDVLGAVNISLISKVMACGFKHPYRAPQFDNMVMGGPQG